MVHRKAAFGHHFFQISVAQRVAQVPTNASENNFGLVVPPLEKVRHRSALIRIVSMWMNTRYPDTDLYATEPIVPSSVGIRKWVTVLVDSYIL